MSFWDNVKKFAQPYSDDEYDDYDEDDDYTEEYEEPAQPAAPTRRSPRRAPAPEPVSQESEEEDDYGFTPAPASSVSTVWVLMPNSLCTQPSRSYRLCR